MNKNHCKQENIRLGTHGEDYGSWMSNPVFYIIGGIGVLAAVLAVLSFYVLHVAVLGVLFTVITIALLVLLIWITWIRRQYAFGGGGIMEQVHRVVLSHLDYDGEGKILEVGCGSGALTIRSALTWPKAKVIGVDYWGLCIITAKHSARRMLPGRAWLPAVYFSTVMRSSWIFLMRALM